MAPWWAYKAWLACFVMIKVAGRWLLAILAILFLCRWRCWCLDCIPACRRTMLLIIAFGKSACCCCWFVCGLSWAFLSRPHICVLLPVRVTGNQGNRRWSGLKLVWQRWRLVLSSGWLVCLAIWIFCRVGGRNLQLFFRFIWWRRA